MSISQPILHGQGLKYISDVPQYYELPSGVHMPTLGLGTWMSKPEEIEMAIKSACGCGYRHFDCAKIYGNEKDIGKVFNLCFTKGQHKREDLFITSKLWNTDHHPKDVHKACLNSIQDLQCNYLDLYLMHWPVAMKETKFEPPVEVDRVSVHETWSAMEKLVDDGLVKNIGVSNFSGAMLVDLLSYCRIKPAVLQIENHPYLPQNELISFCKSQNIVVTGYSPLGHPNMPKEMIGNQEQRDLRDQQIVKDMAAHHNKTTAQILLRWNLQRGLVVIPKSVSPERIKENFGVFDFKLNNSEMDKISHLCDDYCIRTCDSYYLFGLPLFH